MITGWNPHIAHLTGYSASEVKARGWMQICDLSPRLLQIIEQARGGVPTIGERLSLKCADGSHRAVALWCLPLPAMEGTEVQVLTVLREVTAASPAPAGTSDRLQLLGRLAAVVSHEIHNPLNAILLHADILEEELNEPDGGNREQLSHSLEVMKTRVTQLYDIMQEYLVLARLGDLALLPEDLGALLEAFAMEKRERLRAHGITLTIQGSAALGPVPLHKPTFWYALESVVQYAIGAMPHGGTLTLHGQRTATHVRLDMQHDTGSSLSEEQLNSLARASAPLTSQGERLGLSLVREVVLAHQGQFAVTSIPGTATTITVTLPVPAGEGAPAA
jgi:PAS domain S-box-containing protein